MRYSCTSCDASLTVTAARGDRLRCPACGGEMAADADVYQLRTDRDPTRRYDLEDLKLRLQAEKEAAAALERTPARRSPEQVWFAGVQGRQVGPLTVAGLEGLRPRGQLAAATLVWREGFPTWVAAEAVPELRRLIGVPEPLPALPFAEEPTAPNAIPTANAAPTASATPTPNATPTVEPAPAPFLPPPRRGFRQGRVKIRGARSGRTLPPPLPHLKAPQPPSPAQIAQGEPARQPPPSPRRPSAPPAVPPLQPPSSGERPAPVGLSRKLAAGLAVVAALVAAVLLLRPEPPQEKKASPSSAGAPALPRRVP